MGRIEIGAKVYSIDLLVELSEVLHVSVDYLLKGKQKRQSKGRITDRNPAFENIGCTAVRRFVTYEVTAL